MDTRRAPVAALIAAPRRRCPALALARQMYDSRNSGAMPMCADARQGTGRDYGDVSDHGRDASVNHIRGCGVVDSRFRKVVAQAEPRAAPDPAR
ncbi:hypothetical protein FTUN_1259 [Frigoriglobus tundricola]|uniref:Uncharacterized protein n=1 Tax=Frigoriglobus tundricola TaxID=2774151 RepID=A0A6M5YID5_9BACT|nr:hypothetical protein FTUN_1259 [Frigoriglobus tundricola]